MQLTFDLDRSTHFAPQTVKAWESGAHKTHSGRCGHPLALVSRAMWCPTNHPPNYSEALQVQSSPKTPTACRVQRLRSASRPHDLSHSPSSACILQVAASAVVALTIFLLLGTAACLDFAPRHPQHTQVWLCFGYVLAIFLFGYGCHDEQRASTLCLDTRSTHMDMGFVDCHVGYRASISRPACTHTHILASLHPCRISCLYIVGVKCLHIRLLVHVHVHTRIYLHM